MNIEQAIEILKLRASDYLAPQDLRKAVDVVEKWHAAHVGVSAEAFYEAMRKSAENFKRGQKLNPDSDKD